MAYKMAVAPAPAVPSAGAMFAIVAPALAAVEDRMRAELGSDCPQIGDVGAHLLSGGKRLRPALVLLAGAAVGAVTEPLIPVAAGCELIHMATLVHDDLIDASDRRRGLPTVHAKWGLPMSVLMGDHLFAKGIAVLAAEGDPDVVGVVSEVVVRTCTGEIEEVGAQWNLDATEKEYRRRVRAKTGHFIAQCCRLGGLVGRAPVEWVQALTAYGYEVGDCFQVVDDLLDLTASPEVLGKPTGSDLRAGVFTLPVLRALSGPRGPELRALLARRPSGEEAVAAVRDLLEGTGALRHAADLAAQMARRAQAALAPLPPSPYRDALRALAAELARRIT